MEAEAEDELLGVWQRYDESDRGHLVREDVARLLADLSYDVTDDYVAGIMEVYGSFDAKDDAVVEYAEFAALWAKLLGSRLHLSLDFEQSLCSCLRRRRASSGPLQTRLGSRELSRRPPSAVLKQRAAAHPNFVASLHHGSVELERK